MVFRLDELLRSRNITETQLASQLEYSQQYVNKLRRHDEPNPGLLVLMSIARALSIPLWALFADSPPYIPDYVCLPSSPTLRLRAIAQSRQISLRQLARRANISYSYVNQIANNEALNVRLKVLRDLAIVLDVPVWALFADAPPYEGIDTEPVQHEFHELVTP
jgi:transcriptional regulator with XRE-family HTH domain